MTTPAFRAIYGDELAEQIERLSQSPEQQAEAAQFQAQLSAEKLRAEAQLLKEICDGADNGVYGKEGQAIAARFAGDGSERSHYMRVGLRDALHKSGLLRKKR